MSLQVALVLEENFADKLRQVALQMPVWVVKSTANTTVVDDLRLQCVSCELTEFFREESESVSEMFHRIVFSLDDHYNELSQDIPYRSLLVYGLDLESVNKNTLSELYFFYFHKTEYGFVAQKSEKKG